MSAIDDLVTELSRLPTIGRKSALRLTYHLLKQPAEQSKRLATALTTLAEKVRRCERCNNLTEDASCWMVWISPGSAVANSGTSGVASRSCSRIHIRP